jgi:hypothetical protein
VVTALAAGVSAAQRKQIVAQHKEEQTAYANYLCENIRNGYLYDDDLVFVILKGIYGFKFPKRFLKISSRDPTSSFLFCQS